MRNKYETLGQLRHFVVILSVALTLAAFVVLLADDAAAQGANAVQSSGKAAPITFWNRTIAIQRGNIGGADPEERAEHASGRLAELPLNATSSEINIKPVKVEDQDGVAFLYRGKVLFFLGTNDLDKESGEKLDQAEQSALDQISEALQARVAERSWPVIRHGVLYTAAGFIVLLVVCATVWRFQAVIFSFLRKKEGALSLRLFRVDLLPHILAAFYTLLRVMSWCVTFALIYIWIMLSLRRFPYTEPWGRQAGSYVINEVWDLGNTVLRSLPDLLVVILIFLFTRWLARMANVFFDQLATGGITVSWMDADVARATQRIFTAILWIFALISAYPYIPGSRTEAFKGLSVFLGLVISLGSTGIINQIMSGLFVVYSRALKTGEWVKVNQIEGEVLEVGLLAAKIRTIEGQEVTIPNSVLVGTSTANFTRLGHPDGMAISSTVTIGYDAPWRRVHALLELAADRTENILKTPKPYVVQRGLSDFYVEYTLVARLEHEKLRIDTLSRLHSAIQDAFNEFRVQIMSPHYMLQPNEAVIVPRDKWDPRPSEDILNSQSQTENRSDKRQPR